MMTRLILAALAASSIAVAEQETASRLHFTPPANWQRGVDPNTRFETLTPPGGGAVVTFFASQPFAGVAEQWHEKLWREVLGDMKLSGTAVPGKQSAFLTRMRVLAKPDGSKPWLCLYSLVNSGRGEGALFLAAGEKEFFAHLGTVVDLIQGVTVADESADSKTTTTTPGASATPETARPSGASGDIAGLYLATTRQLRLNPLGGPGSADWEVRTEFYLLGRDGRLFRGRDLPNAPGGDITRFDYAAAQREAPGNAGAYTVRGDEVVMRLGDAETLSAKRVAPDVLEIRGTKFTRSIREAQAPASAPVAATNVSIPVLAYTEPAGFYRGASAPPSLVDYTSNNTNAGVQIYHFRPFSGDIGATFQQTLLRDWIDPNYREGELTGPPEIVQYRIPGATLAIVAGFHEKRTGISNERMRMLIVADAMAAIVDIQAYNAASLQIITPAVRALLDSLRVEKKEAPPSTAASPGPAGAALAGLYMGTKSKYVVNLNRPVGYGDTKLALHYYLFSADGRVHCCYDVAPGANGDWRRFDFDAAQRDDAGNTGRYTVKGNQLFIQMSGRPPETITATIRDANSVEIETVKYVREK